MANTYLKLGSPADQKDTVKLLRDLRHEARLASDAQEDSPVARSLDRFADACSRLIREFRGKGEEPV